MRRRALTIFGLVLATGATVSQAEWKMQIFRRGGIDTYSVTDIDSLKFFEDTLAVPEMVPVPAGTFTMGDGWALCGEDMHEVTLTRDFYLGQHEVTNEEYLAGVQWAFDHGYVTATTARSATT